MSRQSQQSNTFVSSPFVLSFFRILTVVLLLATLAGSVFAQAALDPDAEEIALVVQEEIPVETIQQVLDQLPLINQRLAEEERALPGALETLFGDDSFAVSVTDDVTEEVAGFVVVIEDGIIKQLVPLGEADFVIQASLSSSTFREFFASEDRAALLSTMMGDGRITINGTSFASKLKVSAFRLGVRVASWFS